MEYDDDFLRMVEAKRLGTLLAFHDIARTRPRHRRDLGELFFGTVIALACAALVWTWLDHFLFGA